jgi:hypothetical protein
MARDDRSQEFVGVLGFFIAICTLLVVLRCYCKVFIVKNFAADDALSLLTLVCLLSQITRIHTDSGYRFPFWSFVL